MKSKVTVLLSEEEFARLDAYCTERGFKKSTLLARLAREHMNDEGFETQMEMFERRPEKPASREQSKRRRS